MGDDDAVRLMEFILLITGHPIPEDLASIRPATEEEIRDDQTVRHGYKYKYCVLLHAHCGQPPVLVSGFSPEQYQAIYDGIDHHLTAEDMSKISYPLSTLLANLERCPHRLRERSRAVRRDHCPRWALLCMHVGAPISPSLKFCLYAAMRKWLYATRPSVRPTMKS